MSPSARFLFKFRRLITSVHGEWRRSPGAVYSAAPSPRPVTLLPPLSLFFFAQLHSSFFLLQFTRGTYFRRRAHSARELYFDWVIHRRAFALTVCAGCAFERRRLEGWRGFAHRFVTISGDIHTRRLPGASQDYSGHGLLLTVLLFLRKTVR